MEGPECIHVRLSREDLVNMIRGTEPNSIHMNEFTEFGKINIQNNTWEWFDRYTLRKFDLSRLIEVYEHSTSSM